jgi:MarR family transcriptional regulator, 2-MHQ and catechol-resistance regulon repressor
VRVSQARRASRSRSRCELSSSTSRRQSGVREPGATSARSTEADAFEREYPGASWLASRTLRELEIVGGRVEALVADVARRHGLSHAALNALAVIEGNGGPLPTGEISARMHITTGTMTTVLDTLERNSYIRRLADPDDRRRVLVDITPAAQTVLDQMLPEVQQLAKAIMGVLDDDALHRLLDILATLTETIQNAPQHLPPPARRRTPSKLRRR